MRLATVLAPLNYNPAGSRFDRTESYYAYSTEPQRDAPNLLSISPMPCSKIRILVPVFGLEEVVCWTVIRLSSVCNTLALRRCRILSVSDSYQPLILEKDRHPSTVRVHTACSRWAYPTIRTGCPRPLQEVHRKSLG